MSPKEGLASRPTTRLPTISTWFQRIQVKNWQRCWISENNALNFFSSLLAERLHDDDFPGRRRDLSWLYLHETLTI